MRGEGRGRAGRGGEGETAFKISKRKTIISAERNQQTYYLYNGVTKLGVENSI